MADEKLNVSPEENPQPSLFDTGPAGAPAPETPAPEPPAPENIPEQAAVDAPAQDAPAGAPGEVNVSADQIEKLMAEQRAAGRAEVEKNEPSEPEQPPTSEDKTTGEKAPDKKGKAAEEKKTVPEEKPKAKRGRKPKEEKAGPGEPGGTGARKGPPTQAVLAMTDDNLRHRETILPSEKAAALKQQYEAIKHQGTRGDGADLGKLSLDKVGERNGICPTLYLPLFLNDAVPEEHKSSIDMSRDLLRRSPVLVVCGHAVTEAVKNDIAVAQRLKITATTLEGILTVKRQGHSC